MNRRAYLAGIGAGVASLAGGLAVAEATRADVMAEPSLIRGEGDPVSASETVERDYVEYVEATDEVRYVTVERGDDSETVVHDGEAASETEPFERWANRACASVGSRAVLPAVDRRFEQPVAGLGKGVRGLVFGLMITVDHVVVRDEDGSVVNEPNVGLDELVAATPRAVNATITFEGREHTRAVSVAVEHAETRSLPGEWSLNRDGGPSANRSRRSE